MCASRNGRSLSMVASVRTCNSAPDLSLEDEWRRWANPGSDLIDSVEPPEVPVLVNCGLGTAVERVVSTYNCPAFAAEMGAAFGVAGVIS
jgi:hypothetical protein